MDKKNIFKKNKTNIDNKTQKTSQGETMAKEEEKFDAELYMRVQKKLEKYDEELWTKNKKTVTDFVIEDMEKEKKKEKE